MTQQDTQPPAETLADVRAAADFMTDCAAYLGDCGMKAAIETALREAFARHRVAALTRRAGGDEESNLGDTKVSEFIAGVKRVLQNPDGDHDGWTDHGLKHAFFRWPTIVRAINIALAATPKPAAGGDAGAVEDSINAVLERWDAHSGDVDERKRLIARLRASFSAEGK